MGFGCVDYFCFLVKLWTSPYPSIICYWVSMSWESLSVACPYVSWLMKTASFLFLNTSCSLPPWACAGCSISPGHISPLLSPSFYLVSNYSPSNPFGPSLSTISSWQPSLSTGTPVFLSALPTLPSAFETLSKCVNAWHSLLTPQTRFELHEGKDCVFCSLPVSPLPSMVLGT